MIIKNIIAREVLDSRGNPTIEVEVHLKSQKFGRSIVPSGASTGTKEAIELRDNDINRFEGKGTIKAVENVNKIIKKEIVGMNIENQYEIDKKIIELDGTKNKSKLGANALLGVSLAVAHARANEKNINLFESFSIDKKGKYLMPIPLMNILNGGSHANNNIDIQEFMIMPIGASSFSSALQMGAEVFHSLKKLLSKNKYNTSVGDEGGFSPNLQSNIQAIELIIESIENTKYKLGSDIFLALDIAASEIYKNGKYYLSSDNKQLTSDELIKYYDSLINQFPIISIEDGLDENDWEGWVNLTSELGDKCQIVGDDLTVTNSVYLEKAISQKAINSILIKLNQIGTISETIETINLAKKNKISSIISHRSGETEDVTIADFSVAMGVGQIKAGSLSRTDRIAKYNQLLRIEDYLKENAIYPKLELLNLKFS